MISIRTSLLIAIATATLTSHAQDKDPLAELEKSFTTKIDSLQKPITERYITALETLKKNYQSRGGLPSAEAVSRELEFANNRLDSSRPLFPSRQAPPKTEGLFNVEEKEVPGTDSDSDSIPRAARGDINLSPAKANLSGGASLLSPQQLVQGFVQRGASATWIITDIPAGIYDIIIDYSSGTKGGGGNIHISALTSEADVEITPLSTWKKFRRKRIGGIRITTPPVTLKISTNSSKSPAGVMALRQVILRPRS